MHCGVLIGMLCIAHHDMVDFSIRNISDVTLPHHEIEEWIVIQGFYHGLTSLAWSHLDATAGGAFLQHNVNDAKDLIMKMVTNQGWNEKRF